MKVAFATQDLQRVDAHFGWAKNIAVYDITPAGNEDKLSPKIDAIKDCALLYVAAIGGSGAARVVANKIHPVKVANAEPIFDILDKLQEVVNGTPPPWLRKALQKGQEREINFEEEASHE